MISLCEYRDNQWQIPKFWKGGGRKTTYQPIVFYRKYKNELYAFFKGKGILSQ